MHRVFNVFMLIAVTIPCAEAAGTKKVDVEQARRSSVNFQRYVPRGFENSVFIKRPVLESSFFNDSAGGASRTVVQPRLLRLTLPDKDASINHYPKSLVGNYGDRDSIDGRVGDFYAGFHKARFPKSIQNKHIFVPDTIKGKLLDKSNIEY